MSVAQPESKEEIVTPPDTTSNPLMQVPAVAPPKQKEPQPMIFNPLVARGSPFKAPAAPSVTAPEPMQEAIAAAVPAAATPTASTPEAGAVSPLSEGHVLPPSTPVDVVAETVLKSQQAEAVNVDIPPPVEALPQVGLRSLLCVDLFCF